MRSNELRIFLRQKTAVYSQCLGEEVRHFSDREESQFITAQVNYSAIELPSIGLAQH